MHALGIILAIGLGIPHDAPGLVHWTNVTRPGGWSYLMPPPECRIGPFLAPFEVRLLSQVEMDKHFLPAPAFPGQHKIGQTWPKAGKPGTYVIYLSADVPKQVFRDTLVHELAHMRGCIHPEPN